METVYILIYVTILIALCIWVIYYLFRKNYMMKIKRVRQKECYDNFYVPFCTKYFTCSMCYGDYLFSRISDEERNYYVYLFSEKHEYTSEYLHDYIQLFFHYYSVEGCRNKYTDEIDRLFTTIIKIISVEFGCLRKNLFPYKLIPEGKEKILEFKNNLDIETKEVVYYFYHFYDE